jgi:hypothetical protein
MERQSPPRKADAKAGGRGEEKERLTPMGRFKLVGRRLSQVTHDEILARERALHDRESDKPR